LCQGWQRWTTFAAAGSPVADQQARSRPHRASLLHSTHAQGMSPSLRMTSRERAAAERMRRGWRTQRVVELRLGKGLQLRGGAGVRQATVHVQQRGERRRQRRAHREPGRRVRLPEQAGCARAGQAGLSSACTASPAAPPPAGDAALVAGGRVRAVREACNPPAACRTLGLCRQEAEPAAGSALRCHARPLSGPACERTVRASTGGPGRTAGHVARLRDVLQDVGGEVRLEVRRRRRAGRRLGVQQHGAQRQVVCAARGAGVSGRLSACTIKESP